MHFTDFSKKILKPLAKGFAAVIQNTFTFHSGQFAAHGIA